MRQCSCPGSCRQLGQSHLALRLAAEAGQADRTRRSTRDPHCPGAVLSGDIHPRNKSLSAPSPWDGMESTSLSGLPMRHLCGKTCCPLEGFDGGTWGTQWKRNRGRQRPTRDLPQGIRR